MGKKIEKSGRESSKLSQQPKIISEVNTSDTYTCIGSFEKDFTELCNRSSMTYTPAVVRRMKFLNSPTNLAIISEEKNEKSKITKDKNTLVVDTIDNHDINDALPKTYIVKDFHAYFMPTVQVESDSMDKLDTITEIYTRGWKVDERILDIFKQCFSFQTFLHTINFWRAGLNEETIKILTDIILEISSLKYLILDNNDVKLNDYGILIEKPTSIQHLSLRYCNINDDGAINIAEALGNMHSQNKKLLTLNLTGNQIKDKGAMALAKSLRYNRTLIYLDLASNCIGDEGVKSLAESISKMKMYHEEIVARRRMFFETIEQLNQPVVEESNSLSAISATSIKKTGRLSKKEIKPIKEDEKTKPKSKEAEKGKTAETNKPNQITKKVEKNSGKKLKEIEIVIAPEENVENLHPLMNHIEHVDSATILLKGNMTLSFLNLSSNLLTEEGIAYLLRALQYQEVFRSSGSPEKPFNQEELLQLKNFGLKRLIIKDNNINPMDEHFLELQKRISCIQEIFPTI